MPKTRQTTFDSLGYQHKKPRQSIGVRFHKKALVSTEETPIVPTAVQLSHGRDGTALEAAKELIMKAGVPPEVESKSQSQPRGRALNQAKMLLAAEVKAEHLRSQKRPQQETVVTKPAATREETSTIVEDAKMYADGADRLNLSAAFQKLVAQYLIMEGCFRRNRNVTFKKLKETIQEGSKETFSIQHLSQLKTLLGQEIQWSYEVVAGSSQLMVSMPSLVGKNKSLQSSLKEKLLDYMKQDHLKWLNASGSAVRYNPAATPGRISQWHVDWPRENVIIPLTDPPLNPSESSKVHSTMREVQAREEAEKAQQKEKERDQKAAPDSGVRSKGVFQIPQGIREKWKEAKAREKVRQITQEPLQARATRHHSRNDLARAVNTIYNTNRKTTMSEEQLWKEANVHNLDRGKFRDHLSQLAETEWIETLQIDGRTYWKKRGEYSAFSDKIKNLDAQAK
jgi:hypothetical protein